METMTQSLHLLHGLVKRNLIGSHYFDQFRQIHTSRMLNESTSHKCLGKSQFFRKTRNFGRKKSSELTSTINNLHSRLSTCRDPLVESHSQQKITIGLVCTTKINKQFHQKLKVNTFTRTNETPPSPTNCISSISLELYLNVAYGNCNL